MAPKYVTAALTASLLALMQLLSPGPIGVTKAGAHHGDLDLDGVFNGVEWVTVSDGTSPTSIPESMTFDAWMLISTCADTVDNDGDGLTDAADPGCLNTDGDVDPLFGKPIDNQIELQAGSDPTNPASLPEHWYADFFLGGSGTCTDTIDNDLDGLTDAADPGCARDVDFDGVPDTGDTEGGTYTQNASGIFGASDCSDSEDNDGDGSADVTDTLCQDVDGDMISNLYDSEGPQGLVNGLNGGDDCFDGVDNNADGFTDAAQPQCSFCGTFAAAATITGTTGDDVIVGTAGNDVIVANQGNDSITGLDGDDIVCAGPGNDKISGGSGKDVLSGSDGNDRIVGGGSADVLGGGAGNDILAGGTGEDSIWGQNGNDRLIAGPDGGWMYGGDGDDLISGGGDADYIEGGAGNDIIRSGGGNDTVYGGAGDDNIATSGGNDYALGDDDTDSLNGGGDTDTCDGGAGTDTASGTCETIANVP